MSKSNTAPKTSLAHHVGKFVWFEVRSPDVEASARFFNALVGWQIQKTPMGPESYTMALVAHGPIAGFTKAERPELVSYVSVDDVDAAAKRATAAGGKVKGQPFDVPTIGRMVEIADPDGAPFFLYASESDDPVHAPVPGSFVWNELWAKNDTRSLAFLTSVLGYEVEEMRFGELAYHVLKSKRGPEGGVMASPVPSLPAQWVPYIQVADVDATLEKAKRLGATIEGEAQDVPGIGRDAKLRSPQGVRFAVMTPAAHE